MRLRLLYNTIILLIVNIAITSCIKQDDGVVVSEPVEVAIGASHAGVTRTSLDVVGSGEQGSTQGIKWSVGDQLRIWAMKVVGGDKVMNGTIFKLATYNSTFSDADFLARIDQPMTSGQYNYYGVYPAPNEDNVSGTQVTYTIPSEQNGNYDPTLDVMVASATGRELVPFGTSYSGEEMPSLRFKPLFHLLRIRIPEGANLLGKPIKRLEITFPQDVVGTVKFDVTNPNNTMVWNNLSNKITVDIADPNLHLDENSNYVWLHIKPGEINGEITFMAYDSYGVPAAPISTTLNKNVEANHITPIALTIPRSSLGNITYIDVKEEANNLGEPWNTMTYSGREFIVPFTGTTSNSLEVRANNEKLYKLAICADPSTLANQSLNVNYDSPNTNFSDLIKIGSQYNGMYEVKNNVPYLFEEDFSRIVNEQTSEGDNNNSGGDDQGHAGVSLSQLPGWSAARFWAKKGTIRLNTRYQEVTISALGYKLSFTTELFGRLDSTPLSKLKEGANVTVCVKFDAGAYHHESSGFEIYSTSISVATHTDSANPIKGMAEGMYYEPPLSFPEYENTRNNMVVTHATITVENGYGKEYFGGQYTSYSTGNTVAGVTRNTRLCFYPVSNHATGGMTNCESNVYLDNIKVSIAN